MHTMYLQTNYYDSIPIMAVRKLVDEPALIKLHISINLQTKFAEILHCISKKIKL